MAERIKALVEPALPPKDFQALRDFRRLPGAEGGRYSPQLAFEVRAAQERRPIALDVLDALGEEPQRLEVRAALQDDPEIAGGARRPVNSDDPRRHGRKSCPKNAHP